MNHESISSGFCKIVAIFLILGICTNEIRAQNDNDVKPLTYNEKELVQMAAEGEISPPVLNDPPYRVSPEGKLGVFPGTGSITYNFRTGDSAFHIAADHVEPAVSIYNLGASKSRGSRENVALGVLSSIGNEARILTGNATGAKGRVIGKHGGAEHIMVDFADDVYDKLSIGDKIQIRTVGTGMKLLNIEDVAVMNMSPTLMKAMTEAGMGVTADGRLRVHVTHKVPAKIMGSGLGRNHVYKGDYDINLFDETTIEEYNLSTLRFGNIVALIDADNTYGRVYQTGAISVGVVAHSRSFTAGHGPGVVTLFSSRKGNIDLVIDEDANLVNLLDIR